MKKIDDFASYCRAAWYINQQLYIKIWRYDTNSIPQTRKYNVISVILIPLV